MTSLLTRDRPTSPLRGDRDQATGLGRRRPLVVVAALGGAAAAGTTLVVCVALGVIGWFLTDAGAHGTPRDGLRTGALGWLLGHGSGVSVHGTPVTLLPLGVTLLCAWSAWRFGLRVGAAVSGHGPDAERIADGERDWTVASASLFFTLGYLLVTLVTLHLATGASTGASAGGVLRWSLLLCLALGAPGIAVGSGRAAIWTSYLPMSVRAAATACRRILTTWAVVSTLLLLGALVADLGQAANVLSRLHTDAGDTVLFVVLTLVVVPNAAAYAGSWMLGPGFAVGTHTLVAPSVVVLGPLPMFPLLAALPDAGTPAPWLSAVTVVPALVAAWAAARVQRRLPALRWDQGALRGCAGGLMAGVLFGAFAAVAGGAVGPGRMTHVGPAGFDVLVHAITAFGLGGLVGGLVMTFLQRRAARRSADTE